jgi:hypothetical protein
VRLSRGLKGVVGAAERKVCLCREDQERDIVGLGPPTALGGFERSARVPRSEASRGGRLGDARVLGRSSEGSLERGPSPCSIAAELARRRKVCVALRAVGALPERRMEALGRARSERRSVGLCLPCALGLSAREEQGLFGVRHVSGTRSNADE